ncbi:serine hydrolase domain-containing protein [Streptomyces sp. TR06-5]|uniref:serine hydrolase domain-containing protein n=1 Tax=unclassified Streptomyces TaxID=2593676 RepID=UPI0039A249FE
MSLRSVAAAVAATVAVVVLSMNSSVAADLRHARTEAVMDELLRQQRVPGILARAEDGSGVWHRAVGVADRSTGRPRHPGDRFRAGSITKTFVATVVLQLDAERRLDLDDTVADHLPGLVRGHGHDGRRITLRQLLGHTSGIHDFTDSAFFRHRYTGAGFWRHRYDTRTARELVRTAVRHRPAFAPGTGWGYSNTNYVLAGLVIEEVTGHGYAEEIERRILRPLGLRRTSLPGTEPRIDGPHGEAYSTLYRGTPGERKHGPRMHDVTTLNPSVAGASGELVSTTGDLIRFYRALLRGGLVPHRQLAEMMTTVPTREGHGDRYGLGIRALALSCGTTVWGHGGGIHGSGSTAAATRSGRHAAAFNLNADWVPGRVSGVALLEAEFCG